eukprot:scaffold98689_cov69-Phaeocystis_antarctica.AAC.4
MLGQSLESPPPHSSHFTHHTGPKYTGPQIKHFVHGNAPSTASSGLAPPRTASRAFASSASYGYGPSFEKELSMSAMPFAISSADIEPVYTAEAGERCEERAKVYRGAGSRRNAGVRGRRSARHSWCCCRRPRAAAASGARAWPWHASLPASARVAPR